MKIAEKSGMMKVVAKMFRPVTRFLFPEIPQNSPAMRAIVSNITANFLGLGNAATPMGLTAMREMDKINSYREKASNSMCTFAVLNSASLQLIPATVIAIRQSAGSSNPFEIIACVWVCSVCTVIVAVGSAKIMSLKKDKIRV